MKIIYDSSTREVVIRIPYEPGAGALAPLSSTGKSRLVAKTTTFTPVEGCPDPLKVSLNLIHPVKI